MRAALWLLIAALALASGRCVLDLVFVLDGSGSITPGDWQSDLRFLTNTTAKLNVSDLGTHVGITQFADSAEIETYLTGNLPTLEKIIANIQQLQGNTDMGDGLIEAWTVFKSSGRPGTPRVLVLITDGKANEGPNPVQVASQLKNAPYNVSIVCVGVGDAVDFTALQQIASPPISQTVFPVSDWSQLQKFVDQLIAASCAVSCLNSCSQHGTCNNGTCTCNAGWTGKDCSLPTCPGNPPCNGHGACNNGTCSCESGWTGPDCGTTNCPFNCSGNGLCTSSGCQCNPGWSGPACNIPVSCPGTPSCDGHGTCNNGTCSCESGWSGPDCGTTNCPFNCSGNGLCTSSGCQCNPGWSGPACNVPVSCPGSPPCDSHGTCVNGTCSCESGWSGPDCGTSNCPGTPPCSGNGVCQDGTCNCAPGFSGPSCQPDQDPYGKCLAGCFEQQKFCDENCDGSPSCLAQCHTQYGGCVTGCAGGLDQ